MTTTSQDERIWSGITIALHTALGHAVNIRLPRPEQEERMRSAWSQLQNLRSRTTRIERERDLLAETARRLTAERDRLQSALERFGTHGGECDVFWEPGDAPCSCGFIDALHRDAARATAGSTGQ